MYSKYIIPYKNCKQDRKCTYLIVPDAVLQQQQSINLAKVILYVEGIVFFI